MANATDRYDAPCLSPNPRWWTRDTVAVVTGGNKGIGFEVVRQLAQEGLTVVLTARSQEKGLQACERLKEEGLDVTFHVLDVLSSESIAQLAGWLKEKYDGLDILVNNAAVSDIEPSPASARETLRTNYTAVKAVTKQFLPLFKASDAGARILNVSSMLGQLQKLKDPALREEIGNLEKLTEDEVDKFVDKYLEAVSAQRLDGWPYRAYSVSKIAINAYTRVLARSLEDRPEGQHIYVNCATPGYCKTDMTHNSGIYTAEEGATRLVWAVLLPPKGPTGQFFSEKKVECF